MNTTFNVTRSIVLTLLCAIALITLVKFVVPELAYHSLSTSADVVMEPCDLANTSCKAQWGSQTIELAIEAEQIRSLAPLTFKLNASDLKASQITLSLEGKEMFMGINQQPMHQVADDQWEVLAELAVCTTGKMVWIANVQIYSEGQSKPISLPFEFTAQ